MANVGVKTTDRFAVLKTNTIFSIITCSQAVCERTQTKRMLKRYLRNGVFLFDYTEYTNRMAELYFIRIEKVENARARPLDTQCNDINNNNNWSAGAQRMEPAAR